MECRNRNLADVNQKMLNRCANSLSCEQEFSGPEVASYLMGWGDRFLSHQFVPIYWNSALSSFLNEGDVEPGEVHIFLMFVHYMQGLIIHKVTMYAFKWGAALEEYNVLDFFLNTYDGPALVTAESPLTTSHRRPASQHIPYLPDSERDHQCRVMHGTGHEMMLQFIGRWFPRNDKPETSEFYSASMLMLLKPWWQLVDLIGNEQSFCQSRAVHLDNDPEAVKVMQNIQYYYECFDAVKRSQASEVGESSDTTNGQQSNMETPATPCIEQTAIDE
ncbi:hypothetical protein Hypma_002027 [Hypsizygus marmoreus]|uniref:Uncharacterized protein n=1 Tax=Hypsizygus marmoreus TaxID=39966 RepID=A0A369J8U3_HYPMA|nr:hypothetical protein Hypma_002027 [Hypsizygus marmoreus]